MPPAMDNAPLSLKVSHSTHRSWHIRPNSAGIPSLGLHHALGQVQETVLTWMQSPNGVAIVGSQ